MALVCTSCSLDAASVRPEATRTGDPPAPETTAAEVSPPGNVANENAPPSEPTSAQTPDCTNPTTTIEINACAAESYRQADAQLNRVYDELMAQLDDANREKLVEAQLAWIEFRDANCEWEAFRFEGGTIQPSMRLGCLERLTRDRTLTLQNYANFP